MPAILLVPERTSERQQDLAVSFSSNCHDDCLLAWLEMKETNEDENKKKNFTCLGLRDDRSGKMT